MRPVVTWVIGMTADVIPRVTLCLRTSTVVMIEVGWLIVVFASAAVDGPMRRAMPIVRPEKPKTLRRMEKSASMFGTPNSTERAMALEAVE